jgi:hypothetical protein
LDRHDPKSECTSIRLPPTSSFSFAQLAADGQDEPDGRTRCFDRTVAALAAFVELKTSWKQPDRSGSIPIERNKLLLFIDQPISHAALRIAAGFAGDAEFVYETSYRIWSTRYAARWRFDDIEDRVLAQPEPVTHFPIRLAIAYELWHFEGVTIRFNPLTRAPTEHNPPFASSCNTRTDPFAQ